MKRFRSWFLIPLSLLALAGACGPVNETPGPSDAGAKDPGTEAGPGPDERAAWALALHGGAGTIPPDTPVERRDAYLAALRSALELGRDMLERGDSGLDTVEAVIRHLEDDPLFNSGKGAVFNHEGQHELDASIMDGSNLACGAVAGVRTVRNPISLARLVMEKTKHVLLAGPGAERFADEMGVQRVDQDYFYTEERWKRLQEVLESERLANREQAVDRAPPALPAEKFGTVGVVALDRKGHLAAGTSTGGLTNKKFGRVGDSPIVGAGTYADDRTCGVSGTGVGEEFIRHGVARGIAARMEFGGQSLAEAARVTIHEVLQPGIGGIVAVSRQGEIAMVFNTTGMFRGAADANGRFEVAIWD